MRYSISYYSRYLNASKKYVKAPPSPHSFLYYRPAADNGHGNGSQSRLAILGSVDNTTGLAVSPA